MSITEKRIIKLYLGSMIVNGINNDAKPAAAKLGMIFMQLINILRLP